MADRDNVCDVIGARSGEPLLRLMASACQFGMGMRSHVGAADKVAAEAVALGLMEQQNGRLALTNAGSLVGNVAKEYCNWLAYGRRMPPPRPPEEFIAKKDVLDLGCGFGRWLWEFQTTAKSVLGIELQSRYIALGAALAKRENIPVPEIRHGTAEELDRLVAANSLDFIFCRLMFNHVAIVPTLRKVVSALRSCGVVWIQVTTFSHATRNVLHRRGLRGKAFDAFGLLNTFVCMATGVQIRLRNRGKFEDSHQPAYPTVGWWKKALKAAGLTDFRLPHINKDMLVFSARKP